MFNTRLQIVQRLQDIVTFKMSRSRKKYNVRKVKVLLVTRAPTKPAL